jgi:methylated-DNA-[protein]-cysteine S-methyltransferase
MLLAIKYGGILMNKTYVTQLNTQIGPLRLEATDKGLLSIEFKKTSRTDKNIILDKTCIELKSYFAGQLTKFTVPLALDGTEFQLKCWHELKKIKYGKTISYKDEAIKLGGANYARAVAGANNKNKLPIIKPCHRVIGTDGALVGYAVGLKIKKALLDLETKNLN